MEKINPIKVKNDMKVSELIDEMKNAGYEIYKSFDFLSEQSFTIFSIK